MDPIQAASAEPIRRRTPGQRQADPLRQDKENHRFSGLDDEKVCHGCQESMIKSRHLINLAGQQQHWHPECFKCTVCQLILAHEDSCHIYKEKIICRDDYAKLQREISTKCARCRWPVAASDWVRRAANHVYHLACFTCDLCMRQLSTGEQFTLSSQANSYDSYKLICRLHFAIDREQQQQHQPDAPGPGKQSTPAAAVCSLAETPYNTAGNSCPQQGEPADRNKFSAEQYLQFLVGSHTGGPSGQHRQQSEHPTACTTLDNSLDESQCLEDLDTLEPIGGTSACSSNGSLTAGAISGAGGSSKSKRVRTTFTEDQLSILQTHFQIDSNPDGQDLERIATITGLSKRVTQVWFQNSRARQKKYMIKRKPILIGSGVAGGGCGPAGGIPSDHNTTVSQFSGHSSAQLADGCQSIRWPAESIQTTQPPGNPPQLQPDSSCSKGHEPHLAPPSQPGEFALVEVDMDEAEGEDEEGDDDDDDECEEPDEEEVVPYNARQDFRN